MLTNWNSVMVDLSYWLAMSMNTTEQAEGALVHMLMLHYHAVNMVSCQCSLFFNKVEERGNTTRTQGETANHCIPVCWPSTYRAYCIAGSEPRETLAAVQLQLQ